MNFDEYQSTYFSIYQAFADTVRFILEQALKSSESVPRPQSVQSRAKSVESLRRRLAEQGKLDTQTLESDRRDLAGARLIFYTNNDVDRFLSSALIRENFEIEEDSTKVHHPTPENKRVQYRAIHYTVRLREDRLRLPEYKRFAGLRCEIQVQTILNHAYSETSHDITYKGRIGGDGYGTRAMKAISQRFERIMDKYLIPAGYEIQKAQQEFERLLQGKELFDKNIGDLLSNAANNNQRYEILTELKDNAIPNYDDLPQAYQGLKGPLLATVRAARATDPVPIETTYGNMDGFKADSVVELALEVIERLRYSDVTGTLQILTDIYRGETGARIREQIIKIVSELAEYNIDAYNQVGPSLQMALIDHLAAMSDAEVDSIRPIAMAVWTEAIQSDITGRKWRADSVTLQTGAVPASDQLKAVRNKAIHALLAAYDRSTSDTQRREVLSALNAATRTPTQAQYSNELLATTLKDSKRIVDFVKERAKDTSFELLQHLENQYLYDYFRTRQLVKDPSNKFGCQDEARALAMAILEFRDLINANDAYIKYKVLVGFESVYPMHWDNEQFDFTGADEYRRAEADRYIEEINPKNETEWFSLIQRCSETKSNDVATFPVFGNFLSNLAERKPEVASRLLVNASEDLRRFLAGFLNGLSLSGNHEIYNRVLNTELQSARNLAGVARHLRYSTFKAPDLIASVLKQAIERADTAAVVECLSFSFEHYDSERIPNPDVFVGDALAYLNARGDANWIWETWYLKNVEKFYDSLSAERAKQVFESLGYVREIKPQAERILTRLAQRWPGETWDYFERRLYKQQKEAQGEERFEAVPFRFHGLEKELSKDPQLAIEKGLAWFTSNPELFQFRGGRMLSNAFPNCTPEFSRALAQLVTTGGDTEADFALEVLQNYHGEESTHVILKELVSRYADDQRRMAAVRICIDSTGMVSGELGFAEAWQARKALIEEWRTDERPAVREFAEKHIRSLELRITDEHRRAEADREMRIRDYEEDDDDEQKKGPEMGK